MVFDYDYIFKLLLIGDSEVGKSSLLLRFAEDSFTDKHMVTIGLDFRIKTFELDGLRVKLQIWDTAGEERFRTITSSYYRGAHGIVLVFDLTRPETLKNIPKWIAEIEKHVYGPVSQLMVGNKVDCSSRRITSEEATSVANSFEIPYLETSAKASTNVEQMFFLMAKEMKNRYDHNVVKRAPESGSAINLDKRSVVKRKSSVGCCNVY